ncbi:MAG: phytanoyl-CoA dioxygenase family protein [Candidatus Parcubacteria bacterium]|nr:phytanoyl-CoA dioxygenase family protein [Burkholderiales bacterium]
MSQPEERKNRLLKSLSDFGYGVLEGVLSPQECAGLCKHLDSIEAERRASKDIFTDEQRVMLWNIHQSHPEIFLDKINVPEVMSVVKTVLKEEVTLGSFIGIRNQDRHVKLNAHIDARVPTPAFEHTIQMVAMFCMTDFTVKNGSTLLWPLSHRSGLNPKEIYAPGTPLPGHVQVEAKAGDVLFFLGQTWHDVGPNLSGEKRWGLLSYYARWWVKPSFDYTACGPELFKRLSSEQKVLLGFNSRPPKSASYRLNTVMPIGNVPEDYDAALGS